MRARQEKTPQTAPIDEGERAKTPQGRAQSKSRPHHTTHEKEHTMKRGHVTGHKKERRPQHPWWAEEEEAAIRKVEAEWQAKQASK